MRSLKNNAKVFWTTADLFYVGEIKFIHANGDATVATHCHTPMGLPVITLRVPVSELTNISEDYFRWCLVPGNMDITPRWAAEAND